MISVEIRGGMGNQMFQYAFALSRAQKLNCKFTFLEQRKPFLLHSFFELDDFSYKKEQFRHILFKLTGFPALTKIEEQADFILESCMDSCNYHGFFQSYRFFEDAEALVRQNFRVKKHLKQSFEKKFAKLLNKPSIAIHVRRGDYLTHKVKGVGTGVELPFSYYEKCLKQIKDLDSYQLLVVGDDPEWARVAFAGYPNVNILNNSAIEDFQLLLNARKLIIANSSFSWWAGFLNAEREVWAPKGYLAYGKGGLYPEGIEYQGFKWLG